MSAVPRRCSAVVGRRRVLCSQLWLAVVCVVLSGGGDSGGGPLGGGGLGKALRGLPRRHFEFLTFVYLSQIRGTTLHRLPSSRGGKGGARYMCCVAYQLCLESALIACATALCLLICRLHPYISRLKCETPCKVDLGGCSLLESTALETYWRPSAQLRYTKVKTQNAAGGARVKLYRARHHQGAHRRCLRRR